MNRPVKHSIPFKTTFSISSIIVQINKFLSAEHRSVKVPGKCLASQTLRSDKAKTWNYAVFFPEKQTFPSQKPKAAIH